MPRRVIFLALLTAFVVLGLAPQTATPGVDGTNRLVADQTFTDPTGDSKGRLDILTVRASSTGNRLDIRVTTREQTINSNEHISIDIDTNFDGTRDIGFYFRGGGSGTLSYVRYPSGGFVPAPASLGTTSGQNFGITFNLLLSGLGSPPRIKFDAAAKEAPLPDVWDWAPDTGYWDFEITGTTPPPPPQVPPPPPPDNRPIEAKRSWIEPETPRPGRAVVVGAAFVYSGTNQSARGGKVSCRGKLGSRGLPGRAAHRGGTGTCLFRLPSSAAGKAFSGRVTLQNSGYSAYSELTRLVIGLARIELVAVGASFPGVPVVGQRFQTSFRVTLKQPGAGDQVLKRANVTCPATLGGFTFPGKGRYLFDYRNARCEWTIPSSARGSTLKGRVVVRAQGLTSSKSFSYPVR